jgi:hypothetical protein
MRLYFQRKGGNLWRKPEVEAARRTLRQTEGWNPWTPAKQAAFARREAQKRGADSEKFLHPEIYERDGWVCGICGDPVSPELKHPHPLSASIDHIDPLSLGGPHSRANVRCSHLTCNVARSNHIDPK